MRVGGAVGEYGVSGSCRERFLFASAIDVVILGRRFIGGHKRAGVMNPIT